MMLVFSRSAVPKNSSFIWEPSNMSVFSFGQLLSRLGNDFPWMLRHFTSVKDSIKGQFWATIWILSSVTQSHCAQSKIRSWCFLRNMLLNSPGLIQQWRPAERRQKREQFSVRAINLFLNYSTWPTSFIFRNDSKLS